MASWAQTRDAIVAAIVSASGLPASKVLWSYQDRGQPALSYVALSLGSSVGVGQDGLHDTTDLTRAPGREVKREVLGYREISLDVQVYTAAVVATDPSPDGDDALAIAEQIRTSFRLPSLLAALQAVAVSAFDPGTRVIYVPAVAATAFRGRATWSCRCYMPAPAVAEYVGYIRGTTVAIVDGNQTLRSGPLP